MSLRKRAASGVRSFGIATILSAAAQIAQLLVLARLLKPEDFGLMAMILVVFGFAQVFADMGVSNAIIHRQDPTREELSSLYWLNLGASVTLYALIVACKPLILFIYTEPRLDEIVPLVALVFVITAPGQQFQVLLEKNLRFRELAVAESFSAIAGAMVAISMALAGQGVYALVYGILSSSVLKSCVLVIVGLRSWRPQMHFRLMDLKGYLRFGMFQMGEKSVNYFGQRFDQLLIGIILGAQELGYYNLASTLVFLPYSKINPVFTRVAFPIFSRARDDLESLKSGFMTMRNLLASINFPLLFGMIAVAPEFVPVVLGEEWLPSIIPMQILALVGVMRSLGSPTGPLLLAVGRPDLGFYFNCFAPALLIPAAILGAWANGAVGVSIGILLATLMLFWMGYLFMIRRIVGPCLGSYVAAFGPAGLTSVIMALLVVAFGELVALDPLPRLIAQVAFGGFVYGALNWLFCRRRTLEIVRLALGRDA